MESANCSSASMTDDNENGDQAVLSSSAAASCFGSATSGMGYQIHSFWAIISYVTMSGFPCLLVAVLRMFVDEVCFAPQSWTAYPLFYRMMTRVVHFKSLLVEDGRECELTLSRWVHPDRGQIVESQCYNSHGPPFLPIRRSTTRQRT